MYTWKQKNKLITYSNRETDSNLPITNINWLWFKSNSNSCILFPRLWEGDVTENNKFAFTQLLFLNIRGNQSKLRMTVQAFQTLFCFYKPEHAMPVVVQEQIQCIKCSILALMRKFFLSEWLMSGLYVLNAPSSLYNRKNSANTLSDAEVQVMAY